MGATDTDIPSDLIAALRVARRVAILTGAGASAESDIPTFRDPQEGLWASFNPQELATPEAFRRDPKRVWEWYEWRRQRIHSVAPNPGHLALAELEWRAPHCTLVTQNVDGLHQRAGSRRVLELHGNITRAKCFDEDVVVSSWEERGEVPPRCQRCGGMLRPDVVWFGEMLPMEVFEEAELAARSCDVFLCVGTSAQVQPAADLPFLALRSGAAVLEVNPKPTPLSRHATWVLRAPAGHALPALVKLTWPEPFSSTQ
jgi:NAD-dependent deacetylase